MPVDPELLAEVKRRGLSLSQAKSGPDSELLAEMRRRGIGPKAEEPTILSSLRRNLLTNKKVDWSGQMARSLPASIGAGTGAALAAGPSLALGPFAPLGIAGGAYVGGVVGEGLRNAAVGLDALYHREEPPSAGEGLSNIGAAGMDQAAGQLLASGITHPVAVENVWKPAYQMAKDRAAGGIKMFAGIPEAMTNWAMKRGPKEILTATNAEPVMQQTALEGMREAAIGQKRAAGALVGEAENNFLADPKASTLFDLSPSGKTIRGELKRPIFDPQVVDVGNAAAEKGALENLAGKLESGPATGRQLIGLKKNLGNGLDWNGSPIPNPSGDTERIIKGTVEDLRGTLANADPEGIGAAHSNYHEAADLYSKYQKPLGDTPKPSADNDKNTINRLRIAFGKGDAAEGLTNFDRSIQGSREASLRVRENLPRPSPEPLPAPVDRSQILARKAQELQDAKLAAGGPTTEFPTSSPAQTPPYTGPGGDVNYKINPNSLGLEPLPQPPATVESLPDSPAARLRAAAARLAQEQGRAAAPAPSGAPLNLRGPEGPGWLDQPATTPGSDFMDATAAAAFYAKSDPLRSPSSTVMRALAAAGPATAARWGLKTAQTGVQAARAVAPSAERTLPQLLAEILRRKKEEK